MSVALCRGTECSNVTLVFISRILDVNFTCVLAVFCEWKTLSIEKIISLFSQVNFLQIRLECFINTESMCVYFFFLKVYVDIIIIIIIIIPLQSSKIKSL